MRIWINNLQTKYYAESNWHITSSIDMRNFIFQYDKLFTLRYRNVNKFYTFLQNLLYKANIEKLNVNIKFYKFTLQTYVIILL